jgi:hypothetical protein
VPHFSGDVPRSLDGVLRSLAIVLHRKFGSRQTIVSRLASLRSQCYSTIRDCPNEKKLVIYLLEMSATEDFKYVSNI